MGPAVAVPEPAQQSLEELLDAYKSEDEAEPQHVVKKYKIQLHESNHYYYEITSIICTHLTHWQSDPRLGKILHVFHCPKMERTVDCTAGPLLLLLILLVLIIWILLVDVLHC